VDDQERREAALARLKAKREFITHLITYFVVNGFLVGIWYFTQNGGGYFWPIWPIMGWGIGVVMHAWDTYRKPISEDAIRKEMDKGDY
jgi:hypothetical protein